MRKLTENEVNFIKKTGWTPTVQQCSEYKRTNIAPYYIDRYTKADAVAKEDFNVDLVSLYDKTCALANCDGISLEYEATYLFYTFFDKEELLDLDPSWALNWLQDFKYYYGYRKWDEKLVEEEIQEALDIHAGTREFYEQDGDVWNREVE